MDPHEEELLAALNQAHRQGERVFSRAETAFLSGAAAVAFLLVRWEFFRDAAALRLPAAFAAGLAMVSLVTLIALGVRYHLLRRRVRRLIDELEADVQKSKQASASSR